MVKQQYKNALKSKRLIKEAFVTLISEKDISQVRIKEIIELAELSKGTFYAHYQDIYGVLEDIENENIERFTAYLSEDPCESLVDDFTPFLNKMVSHIADNKEIYKNLFKSNVALAFLNKLQTVFVDYMMTDTTMLSKLKSEKEAKYFFTFIAVGTASLIRQQFLSDKEQNLEEMIFILNNGILHGIDSIRTK